MAIAMGVMCETINSIRYRRLERIVQEIEINRIKGIENN